MSSDRAPVVRRLSSLVWLCQRVAINHLDAISSVDRLPYQLVKPILESCSADHLARLEQASDSIALDTADVWRRLCQNTYKQFWAEYEDGKHQEPDSWKEKFFDLRIQEAKKFEMLGAKLRNKRVEHEERKKEKEVKYTDKILPAKKQRTWGQTLPKTLFEKTRSRTAQMQKGVYTYNRMLPQMPSAKCYSTGKTPFATSTIPHPAWSSGSASSSSPESSSPPNSCVSGSRVTVRKVVVRKQLPPPEPIKPETPSKCPPPANVQVDPPPIKAVPSMSPGKRDPMGTLFMPKSRASSQLPHRSLVK